MSAARSILILAAICAGCAAPEKAPRTRPQASWQAPSLPKVEPDPPVRVDRTLIYPVRWGRAEDLAATLQPLLLQMYGPGVRIVPQVPSNRLLILIPPREERESAARSDAGAVKRQEQPRQGPDRALDNKAGKKAGSRGFRK